MPDTTTLLNIYGDVAKLANVYRHNNVTFDTSRRENVAEHSYSLAALGCALAHELNRGVSCLDEGKIAQFAIVHDLTEAYMEEGDISVYADGDLLTAKKSLEEKALQRLEKSTEKYPWIADTIKEYEHQQCPEARFVYALDKMIVHMSIILNDHHHAWPTYERYLDTEKVARDKITMSYPELLDYFDELCSQFKDRPHLFSSK